MVLINLILLFITSVCFSLQANANILFEGYFKITLGSEHIGYSIQRYEYDSTKKQFIAKTFLKLNEKAGDQTDSLVAISGSGMEPVSYQFTSMSGKEIKTVDATFKNEKIAATIKEKGKTKKINNKLPKGVFLGSFLNFVMLKSPSGIKTDSKYDYQAIAEEDASIEKGLAVVTTKEDYKGFSAYKVSNTFKGQKWNYSMSEKGEYLLAKSPALNLQLELVAQSSLATQGIGVPQQVVKALFGDIPLGTNNTVAEKK